ncbi:MAG: fibrobacter succinogenes major paralogous domain-containing protein, partial [Dysgonamonadaceae bacterium]|nr:fibrobacter succinogenes major paralogous domain-containing protein [Dysgonamonadaceae bacterium]
ADTIVLQCVVNDGTASHTLKKRITVGDRDECSPIAGLADAEGNRYTVSKFGGVCWMTQNLRSTYTMQGNLQQTISKDNNEINDYNAISYYYPYAKQLTFEANPEYGLLYTWGAANIGTATTEAVNVFPNKPSERQGICPDGWVIPSDYDWNQLEKEIATNPSLYSTQTTSYTWDEIHESMTGYRPGEGSTVTWWGRTMKSPTAVTTTATNGVSNTNGTGFNALIVGTLTAGTSGNYGSYVGFWSGSSTSATAAWRRGLYVGYSSVDRGGTSSKSSLFSIRCKK